MVVPPSAFVTTAGQAQVSPATAPTPLTSLRSESSTTSFQPPGLGLVPGWQMQYTLAQYTSAIANDPVNTLVRSALMAASPAASFSYAVAVPDLNYTNSSALANDLLYNAASDEAAAFGGAAATVIVGKASSRLLTGGDVNSFVLSTTCNRCGECSWGEQRVIAGFRGLPLACLSYATTPPATAAAAATPAATKGPAAT